MYIIINEKKILVWAQPTTTCINKGLEEVVARGRRQGHQIGRVSHQRTSEPPTSRLADINGDNHSSCIHWSDPRLSRSPLPLLKPTTPRATFVAIAPGVRRRRLSASGAPLPLARPPRERCYRSVLVERHHLSLTSRRCCLSLASGRHHRSHARENRHRR